MPGTQYLSYESMTSLLPTQPECNGGQELEGDMEGEGTRMLAHGKYFYVL